MSDLSDKEALRQLQLRRTAAKRRAAQQAYLRKIGHSSEIDNLEGNAQQILENLRSEQQLIEAGLDPKYLPGHEQTMREILPTLKSDAGDIPGPFVIRNSEGNTVRYYTEEYVSPLTGKTEVRPVINPETGKPLSTTFGDAKTSTIPGVEYNPGWFSPKGRDGAKLNSQAGDRASELVQKHTMWLAGDRDVRSSNTVSLDEVQNANWEEMGDIKSRLFGPDFINNSEIIDGEIIGESAARNGAIGKAQIYTTKKTWYPQSKEEITNFIRSEVDRGLSITDAIEDNSGYGQYFKSYGEGKLKKDIDKVIHLDVDQELNRGNLKDSRGRNLPMPKQDKITIPPNKVTVTDLNEVQRNIDARKVNLDDLIVAPRGRAQFGQGNQIFLNLYEGDSAVTDISRKGLVPQILASPEGKGASVKPTGVNTNVADTPRFDHAQPGPIKLEGNRPGAKAKAVSAINKVKNRKLTVDAPESVTPAVVDTNTDVPTAVVEPEKPVLQQKPVRPVTDPVAPESPALRKPLARPTAQPPRRKPEIINRATARPNPMARPPRGEGGFVVTPGSRSTAVSRVRPRLKGPSTITKITKAAPIADIAIEGGLSYLTGETDRLDHAAWKGVTSLIPDSGAAGGNTIDIGGKLYTYDKETNMITPMGGGKTKGLAYKDGKPVAVDYGSIKGRTSVVDDVVTPIVETGKAIKETAVRRAKEWTKPKPKPSAPTGQRVMAVLNGKEGYMLKGDSSSFRMANWSDAQRKKYYGK